MKGKNGTKYLPALAVASHLMLYNHFHEVPAACPSVDLASPLGGNTCFLLPNH